MQAHIQFCQSTRARLNNSSIFSLVFSFSFYFFPCLPDFFFLGGGVLFRECSAPYLPFSYTPVCHLYDKNIEQIYVQIMDAFSCVFISKCAIVSKNPKYQPPISAPHITMVHLFYCTLYECMGFIINLCHLVLKYKNIYHTFWFFVMPCMKLGNQFCLPVYHEKYRQQ